MDDDHYESKTRGISVNDSASACQRAVVQFESDHVKLKLDSLKMVPTADLSDNISNIRQNAKAKNLDG